MSDSKSKKNRENLVRQFNYCNAIVKDIIKHNRSKEVQEYAKGFAEIESPIVGGTDADWIRIHWGDIYIFLHNDGKIDYQVDPLDEYGGELIEVSGNLTDKVMLNKKFIQEILSLESLPIVRDGVVCYDVDMLTVAPLIKYKPMRKI